MGMMDWVNDEDGDGDADSAAGGDDMDDMDDMDDDFDDEFDDFDDEFDDFDDGDATDESEGDDFDEFGGEFDDTFDDEDIGEPADETSGDVSNKLADFEDRIGELETELGGLSSTMNTVREENKQIGETVDELDDTIRKLLDIYEMVTRGINPFVDDAREMGGLEHGDGAFGLFESEEEDEDDLDPDVVNADAESFFDEDFGDLDPEEAEAQAEEAAGDELSEAETDQTELLDDEPPDADDPGDAATVDSGGGGGSVSFDDLKAEYDEDGGWADDADEDAVESMADDPDGTSDPETGVDELAEDGLDLDETGAVDEAGEAETDALDADEVDADDVDEVTDDVAVDVELDGDDGAGDAAADDPDVDVDAIDSGNASELADTSESESETATSGHTARGEVSVGPAEAVTDDEMFLDDSGEPAGTDGPGADDDSSTAASTDPEAVGLAGMGAEPAGGSDPYLTTLPTTYVAESVAMEWMQFLVSAGGALGASRALRLYEDFGWISPSVRTRLDTYVRSVASPRDDAQNGSLTAGHHETSLSYVSRLGDRTPEASALDALVADGGSHDGIRR